MVGYYRLKELEARLQCGAHIIRATDFEQIDAASRILQTAEDRARNIVAEAGQVYEAEKKRGYADGLALAEIASIKRLISEQRTLDAALDGVERDLVELVEVCIRRFLGDLDETVRAEAIVRQLLSKMRREKRVEMRAPSGSFNYLKGHLERIRSDFPEIELIDLIEDDGLRTDQIVVESGIGRIDGNLADRLDELARLLLPDAFDDDRPEPPLAESRIRNSVLASDSDRGWIEVDVNRDERNEVVDVEDEREVLETDGESEEPEEGEEAEEEEDEEKEEEEVEADRSRENENE